LVAITPAATAAATAATVATIVAVCTDGSEPNGPGATTVAPVVTPVAHDEAAFCDAAIAIWCTWEALYIHLYISYIPIEGNNKQIKPSELFFACKRELQSNMSTVSYVVHLRDIGCTTITNKRGNNKSFVSACRGTNGDRYCIIMIWSTALSGTEPFNNSKYSEYT
jgi:hypothetical protein